MRSTLLVFAWLVACGGKTVAPAGVAGANGASGAAGVAGAPGATGPIDPRAPAAPSALYITPAPSGPPSYVLNWTMPSGGPELSSVLVYQSNITIGDVSTLTPIAVLGTDTTATIRLDANTSLQYLRVAAQSLTGVAGALSAEMVIDTTLRNLAADSNASGATVVASVPETGLGLFFPQTTLTNGYLPVISPDGNSFAFVSVTSGQLMAMSITGAGSAVPISAASDGAMSTTQVAMAWSPDSISIAYLSQTSPTSPFVLRINAAVGGTANAVVLPAGANVLEVIWAPDSSAVGFIVLTADAQYELFSVAPSGGTPTRLDLAPKGSLANIDSFAWLADSKSVIDFDKNADTMELLQNGTSTTIADALPPSPTESFALSPDTKLLALHTIEQELWVGPADGNGYLRIATDLQPESPLAWSIDGHHLAYAYATGVRIVDLNGETFSYDVGALPTELLFSPRGDRVFHRDRHRLFRNHSLRTGVRARRRGQRLVAEW